MSTETFSNLGLPEELAAALKQQGIEHPFDIQAACIPDALNGRDILGRAPTGSGKTLAFGLPALANVGRGTKGRPRALILSPTRELAEQIHRELKPLAQAMDRSVLPVYGGVGFTPQVKAIEAGVDILVACPGRLLDLINQKIVDLGDVDIAIVDEADRMADMGFLPDVRRLLGDTSDDRQTILFSATLDRDVQVLVKAFQTDPARHEVGEVEPDMTLMEHRFIMVKQPQRIRLTAEFIADTGPTMVFTRTRHGADRLARQLKREGVKAGSIHGGRTQSQRKRALEVFTQGKIEALVATDVAARGIHVDGVACVIHYDPPEDEKAYIHRSGRTARAGASGLVVSMILPGQSKDSMKMQARIGLDSDFEDVPELPKIDPSLKQDLVIDPGRKRGRGKAKPGGKNRPVKKKYSGQPDKRRKTSGAKSGKDTSDKRTSGKGNTSQKSESRQTKSDSDDAADRPNRKKYRSDDETNERGSKKGSSKTKRSGKPRPKRKKGKRSRKIDVGPSGNERKPKSARRNSRNPKAGSGGPKRGSASGRPKRGSGGSKAGRR